LCLWLTYAGLPGPDDDPAVAGPPTRALHAVPVAAPAASPAPPVAARTIAACTPRPDRTGIRGGRGCAGHGHLHRFRVRVRVRDNPINTRASGRSGVVPVGCAGPDPGPWRTHRSDMDSPDPIPHER